MSKKTESIEVRVSPELKSQLSEMSKTRRQPMSQTIRDLIQNELSCSAFNSTNAKVGKMKKVGTRRLRDAGLASLSLVGLAMVWNLAQQSPASAQATVRATFAQMDQNEDDIITKEEFRAFMSSDFGEEMIIEEDMLADADIPAACADEFATLEADDDGEDAGQDDVNIEFSQFDTDKDGQIVFDEVQRTVNLEMSTQFTTSDTDKDGFLSKDEFAAETSGIFVTEFADISAACTEALPLPQKASLVSDPTELRGVFAAMDENRDGRISQAEFLNN